MVIIALDHVPQCFSQADGAALYRVLAPHFAARRKFTLSFTGVEDVTSSFINSSLVPFVEIYGAEFVKHHLKVVGATQQVSSTVLRCFANARRLENA